MEHVILFLSLAWKLMEQTIINTKYYIMNLFTIMHAWFKHMYIHTRNYISYIRCFYFKFIENKINIEKKQCLHELYSNGRFALCSSIEPDELREIRYVIENPIDISNDIITISIPMVFHLIDPILSTHCETEWINHINDGIIPQLNNDYNVSYENFKDQYIEKVNLLFEYAHPSKKQFYLNLVETLPKIPNLKFHFYLSKVIMKPISGLRIAPSGNDVIYSNVSLIDPESHLNIVVARGDQILGIGVFPFRDRNVDDISQIDPKYKFRNGVLISTTVFINKIEPFTKFRTFTHEIGHWCGLLHPFDNITYKTNVTHCGSDILDFEETTMSSDENDIDQNFVGDLITDTPTQLKPTYGTVYDKVFTINKKIGKKIHEIKVRKTPYSYIFENNNQTPNFFNFMDYTDDSQMCMFTHYQVLHMLKMLKRFRPAFVHTKQMREENIDN